MAVELQNSPEVSKKVSVDSNEDLHNKIEPFPEKWEEKVEPISKIEKYQWEESLDKAPDITDSVDKKFTHDIENSKSLKNDQQLKRDLLEEQSSNTSSKIEKSQGEINRLELESNFLEIIEDTLNNIVIFLNDIGIKIEKFDFNKIDVLNEEIDIKKSDLAKSDKELKEHQSKINIVDKNIDYLNTQIDDTAIKQDYFDKNLRIKYDDFDEYTKTKNLTPDDIEAINEAKKELINKLDEANVDKLSQEKFVKEMDKYVISTIEKLNVELDDFDIDLKAVGKEAAVSGALGAGVGAIGGPQGALAGGVIGVVTGIAGEIVSQYVKHKGATDKEALGVQMGVELLGGVGLIKVGGKLALNIGKTFLTKADKIDDVIKVSSKLDNVDDVVKPIKTLNESLAGKTHPITGIKFVKEVVETPFGKIEGVFPKFHSLYDFKMPKEFFNSDGLLDMGESVQFRKVIDSLAKEIDSNSILKNRFTDKQIEMIQNKILPKEFTIHHHQETGRYQLVDSIIHDKTAHSGGGKLWTTRHI